VARFLTLPGDVPCVTAQEITALCGALAETPGVVFVPSRSRLGTNAALLAPPDAIPLTFGEPSFDNHLKTARGAGLAPRVLELPGIGLDVDAPDDLSVLLERGPATRSARVLRGFPAGARSAGTR
jgi:2-phospho-L-lactate guanylyltransferase